jgi:cytidylate kinase
MNQRSSSERLAEAMERARRQWQAQRKAQAAAGILPLPSPPAFTIALSREAGANGPLVARAVGDRLGWAVYDRELVQHVAADMGMRTSLLESVDEKHRSWLQECLEAFTSAAPVSESAYARHLLETLLSFGSHGECVLVGRGAAQVLPAAATLRVRLVGPVEDRVKAICGRFGISHEEAKRWVVKTDAERVRFVKDHFQKDPTDPRHYDLVLNSSRFRVPECADLIVEALRRMQAGAKAAWAPDPAAAWPAGEGGKTIALGRTDPSQQLEGKDAPRGNEGPGPPERALLLGVPLRDRGRPGGGQGRVDLTGILPEGIRIDPDITEGHPGYEESGGSEVIPPKGVAEGGTPAEESKVGH